MPGTHGKLWCHTPFLRSLLPLPTDSEKQGRCTTQAKATTRSCHLFPFSGQKEMKAWQNVTVWKCLQQTTLYPRLVFRFGHSAIGFVWQWNKETVALTVFYSITAFCVAVPFFIMLNPVHKWGFFAFSCYICQQNQYNTWNLFAMETPNRAKVWP